eukprot:388479_1
MAKMPQQYATPTQHVPSTSTQFNTGSASKSTLIAWAEGNQYLDVYMVNAFYLGTGQRSQYFLSLWKTATCFGLQFIGILLLMEDQLAVYNTYNTDVTACGGIGKKDGNDSVRWVAFFFATYITIFCTEQIRTLNRYGMYGWGEGQPEFVNSLWVGVGLWVNLFSLCLSWFVSCIIIFTSADILNMVLNSVAVTFMLTLDDEIIGESDYTRIVRLASSNEGSAPLCRALETVQRKIGGLMMKVHSCWQRRFQIRG